MRDNRKIRASIARDGWHCISVPGEEDGQFDFSYSIGLEETLGHPEVSIFGLPSKVAVPIIANCYDHVRKGGRLEVGKDYAGLLSGGYMIRVAGFADPVMHDDYFGAATGYFERPIRVLVLLWPNKQGKFPEGLEGHPQREAIWVLSGGKG